jgi:hypothetical protein
VAERSRFPPLGPKRQSWTIRPRTAVQLPAPRLVSDRNGITRTPSPLCASSWPDPCSASCADARPAASSVYNTVVSGPVLSCLLPNKRNLTVVVSVSRLASTVAR